MSATPPSRRSRVHPAVTVRRAQSERRYLSPWQASCPPNPSFLHPAGGSGWSRMEQHQRQQHHYPHHPHHPHHPHPHHHQHAPRTAFIPSLHPQPRPHHPRMIGQSQMLLGGGGEMDLWCSVRYRPLPPLALGSPPLMLGLPSPPPLPPPPLAMPAMTLEDRLAQDRLTAFLAAGEAPPHRPRSILSCPESPLYESLVSCFSDQEDDMALLDAEAAEHEYQQIEVSDSGAREEGGEAREAEAAEAAAEDQAGPSAPPPEDGREDQPSLRRINTLDVKPEKCRRDSEATEDAECGDGRPRGPPTLPEGDASSATSLSKTTSSQTLSSQENHRSAVYVVNSTASSEASRPDARPSPIAFHAASSRGQSPSDEGCSQSPESGGGGARKTSPLKRGASLSTDARTDRRSPSPDSSKTSADPTHRAQAAAVRAKPPEASCPPLTVELPETSDASSSSWRSGQSRSARKNKSTQASLSRAPPPPPPPPTTPPPPPHIITTLDPPIRSGRAPNKPQGNCRVSSSTPYSVGAPPLVVNFDSEHSSGGDDDDDTETETESYTATLNGSSSMYLTEDDTSSIYSSAAEIYSVLTTDPDSLVYVYQPPPPRHFLYHRDCRYPSYVLARGGGSSGESSGSESSWGDSVSFVEPTYRPSNLSVGSRGHLKIDYSWSWNRLDDFVRTTSPRQVGGWHDYGLPKAPRPRQVVPGGFFVARRAPLTRWQSYLDPVAG